jgi:putative tryptophan/tyrosine transport system substrate-binding protein
MKRRKFIKLVGGTALAWPLSARAQQPAMPVVGFLDGASAWESANLAIAFRRGLSEAGYVEGRNVLVEYRWAEGHYERLPALAADLVGRQARVIAAGGVPALTAAKSASATVPIVFRLGADPVAAGIVASLSRPGGNVTGISTLAGELAPKRLEMLHEFLPHAKVIGGLVNPSNINQTIPQTSNTAILLSAARALDLELHIIDASSERNFEAGFARLAELRAQGLVIASDAFFNSRSEQLAELALRHRLPAIYQYREFVNAGGLMSYGGSLTDAYRLVGIYTGRILKGEKPADLPVQQTTRVELIINMKTAKALGLTFPLTLLGRADEVIE